MEENCVQSQRLMIKILRLYLGLLRWLGIHQNEGKQTMKLLSFLNLAVASVVLCLTTAGCSSGKFASTSVKHPKVGDVKKNPVSPQGQNGEAKVVQAIIF